MALPSRNAIESLNIPTSDGETLHARIFNPIPESIGTNGTSGIAVVLVHPYSKLGGCQGLMQGIALRLSIKGLIAITFDMRGVGRSTGRSSLTGFAEVQDVVAVCRWVSDNLPAGKILLVGSSAGAPIAGSAVDQIQDVVGLVGMGYPFGLLASILFGRHHRLILQSPKPKLFIMGTRDEFTSVRQLENKVKSAAGLTGIHFVEGVSHFQMEGPSHDAGMVDQIVGFLKSFLIPNCRFL